jgi:ribonuclease BN (tRNA processing enzyme)
MEMSGSRFEERRLSRRALLGGLGAAGVAGGMAGIPLVSSALTARAASLSAGAAAPPPSTGTYVVLLGVRGGPGFGVSLQTSTAVVVNGAVYLVDAGDGMFRQFMASGLQSANVRSMFITHLHSDHVADYFKYFLYTFGGSTPVQFFGPGRASDDPGPGEEVPGLPAQPAGLQVVNPPLPTPGILDMTSDGIAMFAYDFNIRMRDEGHAGGFVAPKVTSLPVPAGANAENVFPDMQPARIYADENVAVDTILVHHSKVFPAYAFRFTTADGVVVISGDTSPCNNLITIAQGADVLLNEVYYLQGSAPPPHFRFGHTPLVGLPASSNGDPAVDGVGTVASKAGVKTLVLHHLVPADTLPDSTWINGASQDFSGQIVVGTDLSVIDVAATSTPTATPSATST